MGFEITWLVVIGTDYICSCKSNNVLAKSDKQKTKCGLNTSFGSRLVKIK
jgi:hypothetical protein